MSVVVWGLEGAIPENAILAWGSAALSDGAFVVNAQTRAKASIAEAQALASDGHIYAFKKPFDLANDYADFPLVVLALNFESEFAQVLRPDLEKNPGIIRHRKRRGESWHDYIFVDHNAFTRYAQLVASSVAKIAIDATTDNDPTPILRTALTMAPSDPVLNALRAFYAPPAARERVHRLALASLRSTEATARFGLTYRAMISTEIQQAEEQETYDLIYEKGATEGGGLDVDIASAFLGSVNKASELIIGFVQREFSFITATPQFRLREMAPGSATFKFIPAVPGRSRAERFARYVSLFYLQETLKGNRPDLIEESPLLAKAAKRILEPAPGTDLSHRTLFEGKKESLEALVNATPLSIRSQPFSVLAVVSGVHNDVNAELLLNPDFRLVVSTADHGNGAEPTGASAIKGTGEFLRTPYVATLVRERSVRGSEKFILRELRPLGEDAEVSINSFGSTVAHRAIALQQDIKVVRRADGSLDTSVGQFPDAFTGTLETAISFLKHWHAALAQQELREIPPAYLPPPVPRPEAPYVRVLRSLAKTVDGAADVKDIAVDIARNSVMPMRAHKIRTAAHEHPDLFGADSDYDRLSISDKGLAVVTAYDRATKRDLADHEENFG